MTVSTIFYRRWCQPYLPDGYDRPRDGCIAALDRLVDYGIDLVVTSRWYGSAPVPMSDQPWYLNAVAMAKTSRTAAEI